MAALGRRGGKYAHGQLKTGAPKYGAHPQFSLQFQVFFWVPSSTPGPADSWQGGPCPAALKVAGQETLRARERGRDSGKRGMPQRQACRPCWICPQWNSCTSQKKNSTIRTLVLFWLKKLGHFWGDLRGTAGGGAVSKWRFSFAMALHQENNWSERKKIWPENSA